MFFIVRVFSSCISVFFYYLMESEVLFLFGEKNVRNCSSSLPFHPITSKGLKFYHILLALLFALGDYTKYLFVK